MRLTTTGAAALDRRSSPAETDILNDTKDVNTDVTGVLSRDKRRKLDETETSKITPTKDGHRTKRRESCRRFNFLLCFVTKKHFPRLLCHWWHI